MTENRRYSVQWLHPGRWVEAAKLTSLEQLRYHTPGKYGDRAWRIVDENTQRIVDKYTPHRVAKPKPTTPYKGSWADTISSNRSNHE